jgi:Flp pilus assembly CpaF family ATPase
MIAQAVQRIVHVSRTTEGRCVTEVLGVTGLSGEGYGFTRLALSKRGDPGLPARRRRPVEP